MTLPFGNLDTNESAARAALRLWHEGNDRHPSKMELIRFLMHELSYREITLELQRKRLNKATRAWRKANPGNDLVAPDLGRLLDWLLLEHDAAKRAGRSDQFSKILKTAKQNHVRRKRK